MAPAPASSIGFVGATRRLLSQFTGEAAPAEPVAVPVPVTPAYDGVGCGVARMLQRAASFVLQVVARHHMGAACCTEPPSAPRPRRYRQAAPTYQPVAFLFHFIPHTPFR
jgi:hypothetical protein